MSGAGISLRLDRARHVPFFPGGPEGLLHVAEVSGTAEAATGSMATGPWTTGPDGAPAPGTLGVLIDVVWGGAAVASAPSGLWGMSTEMHASFGAPLPADGTRVTAHGRLVSRDGVGALATGTVLGAGGELVAAGTQRTRFAPGMPRERPLGPPARACAAGRDAVALLGLESAEDEDGALALPVTDRLSNPGEILHGGVLFCASELAASRALRAAEARLIPSSVQIAYLRPGTLGTTLEVRSEVLHRGRTSAAVAVRCLRPDGKPCTVAMVTYGPVATSNA